MKRAIALLLVLVLVALSVWLLREQIHPKRRPNILFIALDDLRADISPNGGPIKMPALDHLAATGTTFLRAYCQYAVCSPSRSSLLTGLRPDRIQVYDLVLHFRTTSPDVVTLPEHFKQNGYFTQALGKIYHRRMDDPRSWSVPSWQPPRTPYDRDQENEAPPGPDGDGKRPAAFGAPDVPDAEMQDGIVARHAVEVLRELAKKQAADELPFFLAVGFRKPHLPMVSPKRYWDLYKPEDIVLSTSRELPDIPNVAQHKGGEMHSYDGIPATGPIPDDMARQLIHAYYAAASFVDAQLGLVLAELDALDLADDTIVVVWSDHGWSLGERGLWSKYTNFEEVTRVPLLLGVPGQDAPGGKTSALAEYIDIYPTLVEAAGLPMPEGLDGRSLLRLTDDPEAHIKDAAYSQYLRRGIMGYSVRTDRYRFTRWGERGEELYDHQIDPGETVNRASDPSYAADLEALRAKMIQDLAAQAAGAAPGSGQSPSGSRN